MRCEGNRWTQSKGANIQETKNKWEEMCGWWLGSRLTPCHAQESPSQRRDVPLQMSVQWRLRNYVLAERNVLYLVWGEGYTWVKIHWVMHLWPGHCALYRGAVIPQQKVVLGASMVVQWLTLSLLIQGGGGMGSIPGRGAKIPHALRWKNPKY